MLQTLSGPAPKPAPMAAFRDRAQGVQCRYPAGWRVARAAEVRALLPEADESRDAVAAFFAPHDPHANVVIRVTPIAADALAPSDVAEAIPALDAAYQSRFDGYEKVEAGPITVGGVLGIRFVFKSRRAGTPLQQCVVTLVKAQKAYTVVMTSNQDKYTTLWNEAFLPTLRSVRITAVGDSRNGEPQPDMKQR